MKILYLVHDLSDPAVKRRVNMLRVGGADVVLAGFSRTPHRDGFCLGYTKDGAFIQRLIMVLICCIRMGRLYQMAKGTDVLIARNLEMLILGRRLYNLLKRKKKGTKLVFECLDIHRLLISKGLISSILVSVEKWLVKSSKLVITSSPAFIKNYFDPIAKHKIPYLLLENKLFGLSRDELKNYRSSIFKSKPRQSEGFWTIGWFGALRCQKSLDILEELCVRLEGKLKIELRGRPAYSEFRNFEHQVSTSPFITFLGEYQYPDDLSALYSSVDFTWAIDFFEEGGNSEWLLPNRIYEGGAFNTVPLYLFSTQIADKLQSIGVGVGFHRHEILMAMNEFFMMLNTDEYISLKNLSQKIPSEKWVADRSECMKLVVFLESLDSDETLSINHMYEL
ncbi:glycosyl transferase family 1 [uncultured Amphritea sp.]|uniref:glycosyl transferase family 1 n=1 Tax=uncultured Amphritea sp. TaxID=981605 RepID=UPI002630C88F|nr:glycosyl transferase family 1 [uncultured Amphritea sp.]